MSTPPVSSPHSGISAKKYSEPTSQDSDLSRQIIQCISAFIYAKDVSGRYVLINASAAKRIGKPSEFIIGKDDKELLPAEAAQGMSKHDREVISSGEPATYEETFTTANQVRILRTSKMPYHDAKGAIAGLICISQDSTDLKNSERALQESEERFKKISESSSEGIAIHEQGTIIEANEVLAKMFGYEMSEIIGKNALDLAAPESKESLRQNIMSGYEGPYVGVGLRKDGTTFHAELVGRNTSYKGRSVRVTSIRDITQRKQVEEALEAQHAFLRQVIDLDPNFVFAKDRKGRFTLVNKAVADAYGTTVENLLGKTDADFDPNAQEVEFFRQKDLEVMDSLQARFIPEERITDATGATRWLQTVKIPITDAKGNAHHILGISSDITVRRRIELLQRATYEVAQAAVKSPTLEALFKSVHEIISSVMPAQNFYISLYDREKDLLSFPYFVDELDPVPAPRLPGKTLTGYVLRLGKSLLCDEATDKELRRRGEVDLVGASSAIWLGVPLIVENKTIGVMTVQHYSNPKAYGRQELEMLEYVSSQVAKAIAHKQSEEALRQSEGRYRHLIQSSPDAIVVYADGKLVIVNDAAARLAGAEKPDQLIGMAMMDFIHPDYREIVAERERRLTEEKREVPLVEEKLIRLDGVVIDAEVSSIPFNYQGRPGAQVVIRDITERKRAEEALRESEERFRSLISSARDAIFTLSPEGIITTLNPAFETITGWKCEEWINRSFTSIIHPDDHRPAIHNFGRLMKGEVVPVHELRIRTAKNTYVAGEFTLTPQRLHDRVVGMIGIARDITERKKLEENLRQAQKMESLGTLAGGIAHDFNNILAIILGHASLHKTEKDTPDKLSKSIEAIISATNRGAGLVRQLLTFARKAETLFESVRFNDTIQEIVKLLEGTFPKTIMVSTHLADNLPSISGDSTQISQVLINLCVNARDAMPSGGKLTLTTSVVERDIVKTRFSEASAATYVQVDIADTGFGMDEATKNRIFDPFFTTKERGKGVGLGLAVAFGIISSHNGFIYVDSSRGMGTTFHLLFPVPEHPPESVLAGAAAIAEIRGGNETILLVEDEDMLKDAVLEVLLSKGYTVLTASDGEEALKIYARHRAEIGLLLSDIGLPKISGDELFRNVKQMNPKIKAIFASGYLEPHLKSELLKAGVKDFIQKPYIHAEVLRKVRETLDRP
jgi:two-component system cell cycle sensor histidine kinase/response regulator CckA